jgi:hypothetical protein
VANDIETVQIAPLVTNVMDFESLKLVLHEWTHDMVDNEVRVRVNVQCNPGSQIFRDVDPDLFDMYSNEIKLTIDHKGPAVFSTAPLRPFPGVDEIVISMTEPLR